MKKYILVILSGFNSFDKAIIYGIFVINEQTKEAISKVLQSFIQIMGSKFNYIISDECEAISKAVDELNDSFSENKIIHLLDSL